MEGITILGLGPGNPFHLTREAWEIINHADEIWLRTRQHPTIAAFPATLHLESFDDLYEISDSFEDVYLKIVKKILQLGIRKQGVIYGVPGDPFIAETTGPEIARQARIKGIKLRIVNGISFVEPAFSALGLDPFPQITLVDALELSQRKIPPFPVDTHVMVAQIYSRLVAAEVKMTLNSIYPDDHKVTLVHSAGTESEILEQLSLYEIDRSSNIGLLTLLYVPPMERGTSFEAFQEVVAALRAPGGCPWDQEQTHQTLRSHLLEEAYETLAALDSEDPLQMAEEFGDLLLQIVLNAQIGSEEGGFSMLDVLKGIYDKIIRRHPHVFGDEQLGDVNFVLKNWEKLKAEERKTNGEVEKGLLDGVPLALPALIQAQEYQDRTARVGFDWPVIEGVLEKIVEEIGEIQRAENPAALMDEMGDLFFALVNLARWKQVDAESALRKTNMKFKKRFSHIELIAKKQNRKVSDLSLNEMEAAWQAAKDCERLG
ncbi:MAG: nucleoside triphosphate pyrophosphohydrolase [Chloroflexota bacterium]